jgi:heme A synthase
MSRSKKFGMWMTPQEYEALSAYAKSREISMAEVVREWVNRLPRKEGR